MKLNFLKQAASFVSIACTIFIFIFFSSVTQTFKEQREDIEQLKVIQAQQEKRVHSIFSVIYQADNAATEEENEFKNEVYENFKFLNQKIDKLSKHIKK